MVIHRRLITLKVMALNFKVDWKDILDKKCVDCGGVIKVQFGVPEPDSRGIRRWRTMCRISEKCDKCGGKDWGHLNLFGV